MLYRTYKQIRAHDGPVVAIANRMRTSARYIAYVVVVIQRRACMCASHGVAILSRSPIWTAPLNQDIGVHSTFLSPPPASCLFSYNTDITSLQYRIVIPANTSSNAGDIGPLHTNSSSDRKTSCPIQQQIHLPQVLAPNAPTPRPRSHRAFCSAIRHLVSSPRQRKRPAKRLH